MCEILPQESVWRIQGVWVVVGVVMERGGRKCVMQMWEICVGWHVCLCEPSRVRAWGAWMRTVCKGICGSFRQSFFLPWVRYLKDPWARRSPWTEQIQSQGQPYLQPPAKGTGEAREGNKLKTALAGLEQIWESRDGNGEWKWNKDKEIQLNSIRYFMFTLLERTEWF